MKKLPKTMKALVAYSKTEYRFEPEYPVPECGPDDILIKTDGCGICAGDLKCQHGAAMFWGDDSQPSWVEPPFIPGHEFVGITVFVGENVKGYVVGDRITVDQIAPCGGQQEHHAVEVQNTSHPPPPPGVPGRGRGQAPCRQCFPYRAYVPDSGHSGHNRR